MNKFQISQNKLNQTKKDLEFINLLPKESGKIIQNITWDSLLKTYT